jgi:MFS transporter, SHS family, lactate transporter
MAGAFLMQFMVQGAWGIIPAHLNELAPDRVRGFMPGFGYQCGAALSGPLPHQISKLAEHYGYAPVMATAAVIVCLTGAIVVSAGREQPGIQFG